MENIVLKRKKKFNIWYISKYAKNIEQGRATRQYLLSKYIAKKGHKITLISSNSSGGKLLDFNGPFSIYSEDNFEHYILKGKDIGLGFNLKRLLSWITFEWRVLNFKSRAKVESPEIIIVSSLSILTFITGIILKFKYDAKLIIEVRDIWPKTLQEFKDWSIYNPIVQILMIIEKAGYKYSDKIVGSMARLDNHVKSVLKSSESKVAYIPMGFDPKVLPINYGTFDDVIPKKKFIVGYSGSIGEANNIDLIIDTAKYLKKNSSIEFYLLGGGPKIHEYKTLINKEHLNVNFIGKVDSKYVHSFLLKCDILLTPISDKEIYQYGVSPNKWIDYMYAAKPIIVPYNGYKNIINDANCGEFIETNNPKLLANTIIKYSKMPKEKLKQIGLNGKEYLIRNLSYDILADKYIAIFNDL